MSDPTPLTHCPVQARCGGCPLMGRSAEEQRRLRLASVLQAFAAATVDAPEPSWTAGPDRDYRNRLRLRIDDGAIAFFNPEKSMDCVVLEPGLRQVIAQLRGVASESPELLREFAWVEARGHDARGVAALCFAPRGDLEPDGHVPERLAAARLTIESRLGEHVLVGVLGQAEPPMQHYASEGTDVAVALGAFLQVNHEVNAHLVRHVLACAERCAATEFVDLYAGCGNFALPLAARGLRGIAVESSAASVASLRRGIELAGASQLRVVHAEVAPTLSELASTPSAFVIADPPRAGLGPAAPHLAALCTHTLLLVSCNAHSLARDVASLRGGFRLRGLHALDMFPHTEHLEVVAELTRVARAL